MVCLSSFRGKVWQLRLCKSCSKSHSCVVSQNNYAHNRYLKRKAECEQQLGDACEIGGFTRLLHSGQEDSLMDEIPTFVAQPLTEIDHRSYPPLDRAYAYTQWAPQANITEDFVLMLDSDHLFLRPLPNLMRNDEWPVSFGFWYMNASQVWRGGGWGGTSVCPLSGGRTICSPLLHNELYTHT